MIILALDTSFHAVSIALETPARTYARFEAVTGGHAEKLLPMISDVMAEAGQSLKAIDRIAVTLGPGGFTGVRVGLSAARGLALAIGCPLVAITSLELLALTAHATWPDRVMPPEIAVAMDARKDAIFLQSFAGHELRPDGAARLIEATEIATLERVPNVVVGSGAEDVAAKLGIRPCLPDLAPDARYLLDRAKHLTPTAEARPLYLRAADAKPQVGKSLLRQSGVRSSE